MTIPTIDTFLTRWYQAVNGLSSETASQVQQAYVAAAAADPTLTTAAQSALSALPDLPDGRDVISTTHRNFLKLVLGIS